MLSSPLVSIIIPTRNSSATVAQTLESVRQQMYNTIEVIIVDNRSTDATKDIARRFTDQVFDINDAEPFNQPGLMPQSLSASVPRARPERSAQRNFGARHARGEFLLCIDSDMELSASVVSECLAHTFSPWKGEMKERVGDPPLPEHGRKEGHPAISLGDSRIAPSAQTFQSLGLKRFLATPDMLGVGCKSSYRYQSLCRFTSISQGRWSTPGRILCWHTLMERRKAF